MRKIFIFTIALLSLSILSACVYDHPGHPHNGDFCPPGQAKKGNC